MIPSFIIFSVSGIIIFVVFVVYLINLRTISSEPYKMIVVLVLMGIAFAVYGLSHYYEEVYYDFNPLIGRWEIKDEPKTCVYENKV